MSIFAWLWKDQEAHKKLDLIIKLLTEDKERDQKEMANIDEILAEVSAQTSKIDGIDALMDGMRKQIADLIASQGNIPEELQQKIDAVFATAKQNSDKIDAAIAENVPA